jgi:hypothetical protein
MDAWWSYLLTVVGVFGLWLAGREQVAGWLVGLGAQVLWIAYATSTEQWGFYVSALAYGSVYARNAVRWRRKRVSQLDHKPERLRRGWRRPPSGGYQPKGDKPMPSTPPPGRGGASPHPTVLLASALEKIAEDMTTRLRAADLLKPNEWVGFDSAPLHSDPTGAVPSQDREEGPTQ